MDVQGSNQSTLRERCNIRALKSASHFFFTEIGNEIPDNNTKTIDNKIQKKRVSFCISIIILQLLCCMEHWTPY